VVADHPGEEEAQQQHFLPSLRLLRFDGTRAWPRDKFEVEVEGEQTLSEFLSLLSQNKYSADHVAEVYGSQGNFSNNPVDLQVGMKVGVLALPSVNSDHLTYKLIPQADEENEDVVLVANEASKPAPAAPAAAAAAPPQPRSAFDVLRHEPYRFIPARKTETNLNDVSPIEYALYQS
jgi:hypothetical protein